MYGPPELRREEKIRYLGEFRERIVLALTQAQVRRPGIPERVLDAIAAHPGVTMVLNGEMEYRAISKYIRLANEKNLPYRKVYDNEHDTEIGLVLAAPDAVDAASIYLSDEPDNHAATGAGNKSATGEAEEAESHAGKARSGHKLRRGIAGIKARLRRQD